MKFNKLGSLKLLGIGVVVLWGSGCAVGPVAAPEAEVKARVEASWQARLAGKFEDAYKYAAPSYRQEVSFDQYRSSFGGATRWVAADIISIACESQKCLVKMSISVPSPVPQQFSGNISTRIDESWIFEENQWWVVPKR